MGHPVKRRSETVTAVGLAHDKKMAFSLMKIKILKVFTSEPIVNKVFAFLIVTICILNFIA